MPIERELRQLWYTAEHYWGNAKAVYDPQTNGKLKCGEVAKFCDTSRQLSDDEKLTTFLIADISSVAVRLITIDERLYEDKGWRIKPRYSDNLNYKLPSSVLTNSPFEADSPSRLDSRWSLCGDGSVCSAG